MSLPLTPNIAQEGYGRAFANIAASTTDGVVKAAVTGSSLRVVAVVLSPATVATPSSVIFNTKPGGAGTAISATLVPTTVGSLPFNPAGWFETVKSEGLTVTTGVGSTTGIQVIYSVVKQE